MSARSVWSTRANALTGLRMLLAPPFALAVLEGAGLAAFAIFVLAVATDFADGWVARRFGEVSPLGGLVDHAVDATFVTAGSAALAELGVLPAVLPLFIALAFLQYALDSWWVGAGGLRASSLGRWNGIAYFVVVAIPVTRDALGLSGPGDALVRGLGWILVLSTLLSMLDRLRALLQNFRSQ
jgi:phosphatidylglycerophosphate synthase